MIQDAQSDSHSLSRNGAARKSLVASIVFLIPTVVIVVSNGYALSSQGSQFLKANPNHALIPFLGLVFEITFLCLPFNFLVSLIVILVGARGLRFASRTPAGIGRKEAIIGIGLSLLVMFLSVVGSFQWASAFKQ